MVSHALDDLLLCAAAVATFAVALFNLFVGSSGRAYTIKFAPPAPTLRAPLNPSPLHPTSWRAEASWHTVPHRNTVSAKTKQASVAVAASDAPPGDAPSNGVDGLLSVHVHIEVVPGEEETFLKETLANAAASVEEAGVERFDVLREKNQRNRFLLVETFGTAAGPASHKATDHYATWARNVQDIQTRHSVKYRTVFPSATSGCVATSSSPYGYPPGSLSLTGTVGGRGDGGTPPANHLPAFVVSVKVKPGYEEEFKAASVANATASAASEPGVVRFDVLQGQDDPSLFVLFEVYDNAESAANHKSTSHYLRWRERVAPMQEREGTEFETIHPAGGVKAWSYPPPVARPLLLPASQCGDLGVACTRLNDGTLLPALSFGTYKVGNVPASATGAATTKPADGDAETTALYGDPSAVVAEALRAGYRAFDAAEFYGNEAAVGAGLATFQGSRDELHVASKCWTTAIEMGPSAVRRSVLRTIDDLRCGYLDLALVHWPVPGRHVEAYKELLRLQTEGLIKSVGVSNYTVEDLESLEAAGLPVPSCNQIEVNPFLFRKQTIDYCHARGIVVQAYRPLAQGEGLDRDAVRRLARQADCTEAQLLLRWLVVEKRIPVVVKTLSPARMTENAGFWGSPLGDAAVAELDAMTTDDALDRFEDLYRTCVVRDTPLDKSLVAEKRITRK